MNAAQAVRSLAAERLSVAPAVLDAATSLRDAGIDSLAAIDLIVAIEERFDVRFADSDLARLGTFEDLAAAVERLLAAAHASP